MNTSQDDIKGVGVYNQRISFIVLIRLMLCVCSLVSVTSEIAEAMIACEHHHNPSLLHKFKASRAILILFVSWKGNVFCERVNFRCLLRGLRSVFPCVNSS